jgi:predicted nucleic acid-binding Zn ribbon protein
MSNNLKLPYYNKYCCAKCGKRTDNVQQSKSRRKIDSNSKFANKNKKQIGFVIVSFIA